LASMQWCGVRLRSTPDRGMVMPRKEGALMDKTKSQGRPRGPGRGAREGRGLRSSTRKLTIALRILKRVDLEALSRPVRPAAARAAFVGEPVAVVA